MDPTRSGQPKTDCTTQAISNDFCHSNELAEGRQLVIVVARQECQGNRRLRCGLPSCHRLSHGVAFVVLPCSGRFFCRGGFGGRRARRRCLAAEFAAPVRYGMTRVLATTRSTLLFAASVILVDSRPGATLGFLFRYATF